MSDDNKRTAFDLARAGFYLVAFVIAAHVFVVVVGGLSCVYAGLTNLGPNVLDQCDQTRNTLSEVLASALAAALAFSGGRSIPKE
jgi:hypothetical protein